MADAPPKTVAMPYKVCRGIRYLVKREQLNRFEGLSPSSQDQNLVFTVLNEPSSLDSC